MMPEAAEPKPMSEIGRITNVFLEPKSAFADIAQRPRPWAPLVFLIVVSVAYMTAFTQRVGWPRFMEQQAERNTQIQNMPADQRAKAVEMRAKFGGAMDKFMPAMPVVSIPAYTLLVAAVFALIFRVFMAADVSFKQLFGIVSYAWLPDVLFSAAAIAVLFLKNPDDFNIENPVTFNVGSFLDPQSTSKAVMGLATSIDLFSFWKMALLAVGISVAARKMSFGKALGGVVAPWLLFVLCRAGFAALVG